MSRLESLIQQFGCRRALVLGDMVLDEYIMGQPARISREAPVLVLHHAGRFTRPGAATNTAHNLRTLGATTSVVGLVGDDEAGHTLRDTLREAGIDTTGLIADPARSTSTKTRILAKGTQQAQQQVVRIDHIDHSPLDDALQTRMIDAVCSALDNVDALIISDYEYGVISPLVLETCLPEAIRRGLIVVADSHEDLLRFQGVTAATPNQPEAEATLGREFRDTRDLEEAGRQLLTGMKAKGVLITRGSEGLVLFETGQPTYALPISATDESQIVDPTGAGDTVAAVFTLTLSAGGTMRDAAYLSNIAGGEVVRRLGAATLTQQDLTRAVRTTRLNPPDVDLSTLKQ